MWCSITKTVECEFTDPYGPPGDLFLLETSVADINKYLLLKAYFSEFNILASQGLAIEQWLV